MSHETKDHDLLRRMGLAEEIKTAMRSRYVQAVKQSAGESGEQFLSRSNAFWQGYEEVNRLLIPDDPVYTGTRQGVAFSTTADFWTLTVAAAGQLRVLEVFLGGEASSSGVLRIALQRSTGGTTPTTQTPEKMNTRSPAAASQFATAWSAAPSLSANPLIVPAFNAFGGTWAWAPAPGAEIYLVNSEQLSLRSLSGTSTCSGHVIWEEV